MSSKFPLSFSTFSLGVTFSLGDTDFLVNGPIILDDVILLLIFSS